MRECYYENKYEKEYHVIPDDNQFYKAILKILEEHEELSLQQLRYELQDYLWISDEEYRFSPDAQGRTLFVRRVYKTVYKLYKHHLLDRVSRGVYKLSNLGRQLIKSYSEINEDMVIQFPSRSKHFDDSEYAEYAEDAQISQFGFHEGRIAEETWFNISEEEFTKLYESDNRFRKVIDSGRFVLHDGQIVPVNYRLGEGIYSDLVCEVVYDSGIQVIVKKDFQSNTVYFDSVTYNNNAVPYSKFLTLAKHPINWETPNVENLIDEILRELPDNIVDIFKYLKRKLGVNWEKLARVLGVSDRILRYWKNPSENGGTKVEISLEKIVAICLALNLPPEVSKLIIERVGAVDKNGFKYDPDAAGGEQRIWEYLLKRHYTRSTLEINELCKKNGIESLFSENIEDHSDGPQGAGRIAGRNRNKNI